jgi:hypothetical protein
MELQSSQSAGLLSGMTDSRDRTMPPAMPFAPSADARRVVVPSGDEVAFIARELRRALAHRSTVKVIVDGDTVFVPRLLPAGADISAHVADGRCSLAIGSWHDDMLSSEMALKYAIWAVEGNIRVRIDRLGGKLWQCALERRVGDGEWLEESVLAYPRFRLWPRQKTTEYLQNV